MSSKQRVFCTFYLCGYTTGASAPYNQRCRYQPLAVLKGLKWTKNQGHWNRVKNHFPYFYLLICFCCYHLILKYKDLWPNCQKFLRTVFDISWTRFLVFRLKKRSKNNFLSNKQKPFHGAIGYLSHNLRMMREKYLQF